MAYPTLEDDWNKAIELTESSKDSVKQKLRVSFEGLEDVENTAANDGDDNTQLLVKNPEIPLTNEQVSVT